jgi:hypothetical protein
MAILTMSMESLLDENVKNGLIRLFGERIEQLPRPQLMALAMAYSEEEITNERLQYALDIHRADITKMLSDMCASHLLDTTGHGRGTKYHVYGTSVALTEANVTLLGSNVALTEANVALTEANVALNSSNVALPKRYSKEQLREKIKDICSEWVTVEEISKTLGRDIKYVKNHIIPQMTDVLEKMYDVPHHPRQKYRIRSNKK